MTTESQETKIAVLEAKVDHLIGHVKELTLSCLLYTSDAADE